MFHTGKYHPGIDKPDPKTWKANFRCAMNSLPDIEEVKDESMKKGSNAFRMYRMLSSYEKAVKKGNCSHVLNTFLLIYLFMSMYIVLFWCRNSNDGI